VGVAGGREYDEKRFRELVLYIAWKTKDDPHFGRTKLAKTLFYSDLAAYAERGQSLTGVAYEHWEHGPFPRVLYNVMGRLERDGLARQIAPEFRGDEARLIALEEPGVEGDLLVDHYIKQMASRPTWWVRDASHQHPGWQLTGDGEEIPYYVAFLSRRKPTQRDLERGEQLARVYGWP
jgi:uncharacterized phage-associated protein